MEQTYQVQNVLRKVLQYVRNTGLFKLFSYVSGRMQVT